MTLNRYIAMRMIVEIVGAVACAAQIFRNDTLTSLIIAGLVTLLWLIGEIWIVRVLDRERPRTDELSDQHQLTAFRFAFFIMIAVLVAIGVVGMLATLVSHVPFVVPPMLLPAVAMLALAVADARYLWLEHDGGTDED
ncbi:hypothetical protein DSM100688_1108 [Bifidobacterium ramosum]|uniref:Uncharacterized protein n=1 Tax=Bifidobacterium ramosum TaxID=1798158 RepID=A0A6L4X029_9BIFI|nr:hypothetical protein [Bifidobacterium ramosum]KAB8287998.1 hypothetical protein DSM100688_1108 [Bifidobacterium ramosum]NEG72055.1 hypothetical protein [Bifidobacterium ramosum]